MLCCTTLCSLRNLIRELRKAQPLRGEFVAFAAFAVLDSSIKINSYRDIFLIMEKCFLKGTELTALN